MPYTVLFRAEQMRMHDYITMKRKLTTKKGGRMAVTLNVPSTSRLPDNGQWTNRFQIRSESSNRIYIVAQNKSKRHFGCSCKGWIFHRKCKHLAALGLPAYEAPVEVTFANKPMIKYA